MLIRNPNRKTDLPAIVSVKKPIPLSTVDSYKKYGVTKKQLHSMLLNLFHFPAQYRDCLTTYYISHWQGDYFMSQLKEGTITREFDDTNSEYIVIYQGCTPYQVRKAKQIKLSYRKPVDDFGLSAYVIVRIHTDNDGQKG